MRRLVAAAALAGALLAAVAPAAPAAAPRGFVGVGSWFVPGPSDFARMGTGKVGLFRFNLEWSVVEATRGTYDWSRYDRLVGQAAAAGVRGLPVLYGSPGWAARRNTYPPRSSARRSFSRFLTAVADRYGRGGDFWREHPELRSRVVTHWQVWNEPNLPVYWNRRPSARQYASLVKLARRSLRRGDRRAKVVLAGLPRSRLGAKPETYLRRLYRVRGFRRQFDVVAIHPYARDDRGVAAAIRRIRKVMDAGRDRRTPIWITEVGWATSGPRSVFRTSRRGQATRVRKTFRTVLRLRRSHRVGAVIWFAWRDRPLNEGERDWWAVHTGLLGLDGEPKPGWRELVRVTGGAVG